MAKRKSVRKHVVLDKYKYLVSRTSECPICGNASSLTIVIDRDSRVANAKCYACGFEAKINNIPRVADYPYIYAKLIDMVKGSV